MTLPHGVHGISESIDVPAMSRCLLDWYERHRRDLPWRRVRDPYAIWVAEIMLQQTRVDTVIVYYERFLLRFPTLDALAAAPLDDVLKAWEGLGYYARARNLHAAARTDRESSMAACPTPQKTCDVCRAWAAIRPRPSPASPLDRMPSPWTAICAGCCVASLPLTTIPAGPVPSTGWRPWAWSMLPPGRASDFNQALMDLGALVCTPSSPRCLICPLMNLCLAQKEGIQNALPIRATRTYRPHRDVTAGVIWMTSEVTF